MPAMIEFLSLLYLAAPYFIFAGGWLRWPYAVGVSILLAAGLITVVRSLVAQGGLGVSRPAKGETRNWILMGLFSLALLCLSGVGGTESGRVKDWQKHNAILHDLSTRTWPVAYPATEEVPRRAYLTYYTAYYLPAAAVGRALGLTAAHLTLFVWTFAGLLLCAAWLRRLVGVNSWLLWAAWFALSGMDALGVLLRGAKDDYSVLEWWAGFAQYSSNVSLIFWVPQHALAGWIATALIVDQAQRRGTMAVAGFCATLTALWSPFVALGMFPIGVVLLLRAPLRSAVSFGNLVAGPVLLALSAVYLGAINRGRVPAGWLFEEHGWAAGVFAWSVFCLLEFGIYAALLAPQLGNPAREPKPATSWNRVWLLAAVITLALLPLYRLGIYNDLVMRASIPVLLVFWMVLLRELTAPGRDFRRRHTRALMLCLAIGAIQPAVQVGCHLTAAHHGLTGAAQQQATVPDLGPKHAYQYLGRGDAFFYRHLARRQSRDMNN